MKQGIWVEEVRAGARVEGLFLVKEKRLLKGRTGRPYVVLKLADRTGEIEARIWERVEDLAACFQPGDLVTVSGEATEYQGNIQVKIVELQREGRIDNTSVEEFLPDYSSRRAESEARYEELKLIAASIQDETLRAIVIDFLEDELLRDKWILAPGAKRLHHARVGGLLEHTLSVARLILTICDHYHGLDRDLLVAGAVLHDVGKLIELDSPWCPDYTTKGRLLGHIILGLEMLEERMSMYPHLSSEKALVLKHMLASHHGQLEFGSPKRPKTLEALILFMVDDLDAKFDSFREHLSGEERGDGWTAYHPVFERHLFRGVQNTTYPRDEKEEGH